MSSVQLDTVTKQFKGTVAVDEVSLTFATGKLTVLVGPSGCGKSTLLRMIAGLEEPTHGLISIGDDVVNEVPTWNRNTAMVFQSYALYPHMTVFENMAFPLRAQGFSRRDIREMVTQAAQSLGIAALLQRKPRQLSGGQMQRVALGRAIVRRPRVFLLDEPLSNLDAMLRVETRAELKRLQRDLGITTIYVTHDQEEAMTLADTLVVMRDGRPEQVGTPEQIYQQPRTIFVGRFIGSPAMNIIPCVYDRETRELVVGDYRHPLPARFRRWLEERPEAVLRLGLRPEHLVMHMDTQPQALAAQVYMPEPLGKETLFTLALGEQRIKALGPPCLRPEVNQTVWLTFTDEYLHLFDAESGVAISSIPEARVLASSTYGGT
jgi:multiple sugar transport system ATP-binding protein